MSMGLNPIFNYVVNKFAKTKIVDSSSFDEYFKLKPEKDQFGYDVLSGLQSNLKLKQTLCFLLLLAQEMEQLKFPFYRTQELRSIIGSFLKSEISNLNNRQYLQYQHYVFKQMEKDQITPVVEKADLEKKIQPQPQKSLNPFGDLSSFMDTKKEEKKKPQTCEKLIFERKNFKISAWNQEKEEKEIRKKPITFAFTQSKKTPQLFPSPTLFNSLNSSYPQSKTLPNQLFSSPPIFNSQQDTIEKSTQLNHEKEKIKFNQPQSVIYKVSKRQILEFEIPKKKPQTNYFSSLVNHSKDNVDQLVIPITIQSQEMAQLQQSKEVEQKIIVIEKQQEQREKQQNVISDKILIKDINQQEKKEQYQQLKQVEEKVTERFEQIQEKEQIKNQKNVISDEILIKDINQQEKKEQHQQLNKVEEKVTEKSQEIQMKEQNQEDKNMQPQKPEQQDLSITVTHVNSDKSLIKKDEKYLDTNQITQDKVIQLDNQEKILESQELQQLNQLKESESKSTRSTLLKEITYNQEQEIGILNKTLLNFNQINQTKKLIKEINQNKCFIQVDHLLKNKQNYFNPILEKIQIGILNYLYYQQFQFELNPFKKKNFLLYISYQIIKQQSTYKILLSHKNKFQNEDSNQQILKQLINLELNKQRNQLSKSHVNHIRSSNYRDSSFSLMFSLVFHKITNRRSQTIHGNLFLLSFCKKKTRIANLLSVFRMHQIKIRETIIAQKNYWSHKIKKKNSFQKNYGITN